MRLKSAPVTDVLDRGTPASARHVRPISLGAPASNDEAAAAVEDPGGVIADKLARARWSYRCALKQLRGAHDPLAALHAETLLRLSLPRLLREVEQDWDAERRRLPRPARQVLDTVLLDCLGLRSLRGRRGRRQRATRSVPA